MPVIIKKPDEIRAILEKACLRREMLILITPFLRFESSFISLEEREFSVLATMSRDDAIYGLRTPELLIRFPQALGFYEGQVQMLGLGLHENMRTLRLSIPKQFRENDQRVAYRVERVGRVEVTFSTPKVELFTANLLNLSLGGARLQARSDMPEGALNPGDKLVVDIPLSEDIKIRSAAWVKHSKGRTFGIQFDPALPAQVGDPLSKWVFMRREEERERMAQRQEWGAQAERPKNESLASIAVLLVSSDTTLEKGLRESLGADYPLLRVSPNAQHLKESLTAKPKLLVFHVAGLRLDDRRRMKTLMEMVKDKYPVLLLGTEIDGASLFELSSELKAKSSMVWAPSRAAFFQRLAQGIIRRHHGGGEAPLAPKEA